MYNIISNIPHRRPLCTPLFTSLLTVFWLIFMIFPPFRPCFSTSSDSSCLMKTCISVLVFKQANIRTSSYHSLTTYESVICQQCTHFLAHGEYCCLLYMEDLVEIMSTAMIIFSSSKVTDHLHVCDDLISLECRFVCVVFHDVSFIHDSSWSICVFTTPYPPYKCMCHGK